MHSTKKTYGVLQKDYMCLCGRIIGLVMLCAGAMLFSILISGWKSRRRTQSSPFPVPASLGMSPGLMLIRERIQPYQNFLPLESRLCMFILTHSAQLRERPLEKSRSSQRTIRTQRHKMSTKSTSTQYLLYEQHMKSRRSRNLSAAGPKRKTAHGGKRMLRHVAS